MANKDNQSQLNDLEQRLSQFKSKMSDTPATHAEMATLVMIVTDLVQIIRAHIYENDDPGQE